MCLTTFNIVYLFLYNPYLTMSKQERVNGGYVSEIVVHTCLRTTTISIFTNTFYLTGNKYIMSSSLFCVSVSTSFRIHFLNQSLKVDISTSQVMPANQMPPRKCTSSNAWLSAQMQTLNRQVPAARSALPVGSPLEMTFV